MEISLPRILSELLEEAVSLQIVEGLGLRRFGAWQVITTEHPKLPQTPNHSMCMQVALSSHFSALVGWEAAAHLHHTLLALI